MRRRSRRLKDEAAVDEPAQGASTAEDGAKEVATSSEAPKLTEPETENKPENVTAAAPAVTAAA